MKLNNSALQELYDTLVNINITISPYVDSPVDRAFRECDDALKALQDRNDILEKSYGAVLSANLDLVTKKGQLEKDLDDAKNQLKYFTRSRDDLRSRAKHAEKEVEDLKKTNEALMNGFKYWQDKYKKEKERADASETSMNEFAKQVHDLKQALDTQKKVNESLASTNVELNATVATMKENDKKHSEKVAIMRRSLERVVEERDDIKKRFRQLEKYNKLLIDSRNEWSERAIENRKQIIELKSRLNSIPVTATAFSQGQTDLWDMLQNVNNINVEEFDVECHSTNDVISMDLEDFLNCYKKWQERKEKERLDHMRDYLDKFCRGRLCSECPLESDEYKCGYGYSFRKFADDDQKIISDEELERYYEKVLAVNGTHVTKPDDPCSGVREKIKEACDAFYDGFKAVLASEVKEVPVSCDIPIKDLASWECTIEATVEVNKDLLEKVCGVKPEEEEHKLEYGDAVRLPWRDYDYMYIGPDEKEKMIVRMFNPKHHAIVTSHIGNVRYNGGKIILTDEDDLRKIWKDKK